MVITATHSFTFTVFLQNKNCSKEILTIIVIPPILQEVCFITKSVPAIHFFYNKVIVSRKHLKKSTCQGNFVYFATLFAIIHYNKQSEVDSRKSWRVCLLQENHCGPTFLNAPIYSTELVAIVFFEKYYVKCTKALTEVSFFHGEPAQWS